MTRCGTAEHHFSPPTGEVVPNVLLLNAVLAQQRVASAVGALSMS